MNDLRSPLEDRPYRPTGRTTSRTPVPDQAVENYSAVYAENYQEYSLYERIRYSRWFPLASVLAAVLLFSVIISYAYKQGAHTGVNATTPVVQADNSNYKEKPANPGGMDVSFQDAVVFDNLQNKDNAQAGESVESLLPPPEQPLAETPPPAPAAPAVAATPEPAKEAAAALVTTATAVAPALPAAAPASDVATEITSSEVENEEAPVVAPVKTEAPLAVKKTAAVKPAAASVAIAPVAKVETGIYRVQLGAFRDEAAARAAWAKMRGQVPQLASVTPQFPRADLGAKGIFYRVQGGNLSKTSADALCRSIAAKDGNCIVQK